MTTMAERLKGVEKDVTWIKDTNIKQSKDIEDIKSKLDVFISEAPKCFASKNTENKVDKLINWKYYVTGAFAVIAIILGIIINYIMRL